MEKITFRAFLLLFVAIFVLAGIDSSARANIYIAQQGKTLPTAEPKKMEGREKDGFHKINVQALNEMLKKKDFLFVNVHTPYEGEIEKTDVLIPYDKIDQNINKLPADKKAKIVLYCRTDRMSNIAARTLVGLGYTNIWVVEGGMVKWKQEGYKLLHLDH
jgi:rhodanese-related sulfurtransferase